MKLEYRNKLVNRKLELKARLIKSSFMEAISIKDEILEIELELKERTLFNGEVDECENCSG